MKSWPNMARRTRTQRRHSKGRHEKADRKQKAPRTAAQYDAMPEEFKKDYDSVIEIIRRKRTENTSLSKLAREKKIPLRRVKVLAGPTIEKASNGRLLVKKSDRLLRILRIPTLEGPRETGVLGSRQAALLAKYWNAVDEYLQTGNEKGLAKFRNKLIRTADGIEIPLIIDPKELKRLGRAGVLTFESIYSRSA